MADLARVLEPRRYSLGDATFMACCPAHDDNIASLKVTLENNRFLLHCKRGCEFREIAEALLKRGVDVRDERKPSQDTPTAVWTIRRPDGTAVAQHVRYERPGGKAVIWRGPNGEEQGLSSRGLKLADLPLYGSELLAKNTTSPVVITEGEKAADAARTIDILALGTSTGADGCPRAEVLECLRGRTVYLWPDNDDPGRKHMEKLARALSGIAAKVETVRWAEAPDKGDAADFVARGKKHADFQALIQPKDPKKRSIVDDMKYLWQAAEPAYDELERFHNGDFSRYVTSGSRSLDRKLYGGLRRGQVTLLGAPTGGAKSTILASFALNAAQQHGGALLISPEMSITELAEREILRRSQARKWDINPWKHQMLRQQSLEAHKMAAGEMHNERVPFIVLDRPAVDIDAIEVAAEEAKRRHPDLAMVAIDYAQEVADPDPRAPRYLAVGNVAVRGTEIARRLDVAVVIASQVNAVKDVKGKVEYSFRESQILAHKAHNVLLFLVDWDEDPTTGNRIVNKALFKATKIRGAGVFELEVNYEPSIFRLSDKEASR